MTDDIVTRLREHYADPADFTFADLSDAADEIERLRQQGAVMISHLKEMFPFFMNDVKHGVSIGPAPDGHVDDSCPDCQWYKSSVNTAERVMNGEFDYIPKQENS
jgi:hypothetical protein